MPTPGSDGVSVYDILEGIRFVMAGVMFDKERGNNTSCAIFDPISTPGLDSRRIFKGLIPLDVTGRVSLGAGRHSGTSIPGLTRPGSDVPFAPQALPPDIPNPAPHAPETIWTINWVGKRVSA